MYSILLKIPQANYLLLKQLIHVLLKIKTSTRNHLETYNLPVCIAPHVLFEPTCLNSLFGSHLSEKVRGSDFSLWEQRTHCDQEIGNTLERPVMLKENLGLHSSGVEDALIYFRKHLEGRLLFYF